MSSFDTYCVFNALQLHFNSSYDYFKYNGKVKVTIESFENRRDKYYFKKLNRKIPLKNDLTIFLTSNFIEYDKIWIGKLLEDVHYDCYLRHRCILESLEYKFKEDCDIIFDDIKTPIEAFKMDNDYPKILKLLFKNEINIESLCILSNYFDFIKIFDNNLKKNIRWKNTRKKIIKYEPFINYDKMKYKEILSNKLKEYNR